MTENDEQPSTSRATDPQPVEESAEPETSAALIEDYCPTVYEPDKIPFLIYTSAIILEIVGKIFVCISCFPPIGSDTVTSDQKSLAIVGGLVLLSLFNAYYLLYLGYVKDEIPLKRQLLRCPRHLVSYLAFFNLVLKVLFAKYFFTQKEQTIQFFDGMLQYFSLTSFHHFRPFFMIFLTIADIAIITTGICYCLQEYKPLKHNKSYIQIAVNRKNGPNLSILESRAFFILIKNEGRMELEKDELSISRRVFRKRKGFYCLCKTETTEANFTISTPAMKPGESITIIPEMHFQDGTVGAPKYRAFGYDVAEKIVTVVRRKKEVLAKLTEEYKRRGEENEEDDGIELGEVCPNWSRTAQNPNYMRTLM